MYDMIMFDLDGTLLPLDIDTFVRLYLPDIGSVHDKIPTRKMMKHILDATDAAVGDADLSRTNEQKFIDAFIALTGLPWDELGPLFDAYYRFKFPAWREHFPPEPRAAQLIDILAGKGVRMALATNPIFPLMAIEERIRWAGIDPARFELITAYENMHTCKPHRRYYDEVCALAGVTPARCLMVGNDMEQDILPAREAGMATLLLTNNMIGQPDGSPSGDFDALMALVRAL